MRPDLAGSQILVVDDTRVNLDILVDTLKHEYVVAVAIDGEKGLAYARKHLPDLILLDIMMPGMDGFEVCRRLKEEESTRDIPVIFITALAGSQTLLKGFEYGAVDYIVKPFDPAEVRARVKTHLRLRNAEIALLQRNQELDKTTATLEASNKRLRELDDIKSSFLSAVAHELRTPLTSILGFAKLIRKDFLKFFSPIASEPKLADKGLRIASNLEIVSSEGERLSRMINDVLDLAKIESGRFQWRDAALDPAAIIRQAAQAVLGQFNQNPDLKLALDIPDALPTITADRDRLEQVLINLLNNAAKFTPRGSVRVVAASLPPMTQHPAGGLRVAVIDTGMGIPAQDLDRIFDKFHQVIRPDTLTEPYTGTYVGAQSGADSSAPPIPKGTGLGLSICKQIVEHYGGKIWAESELGQGASIIFELPARGA